ncbi:MAG: hypothetical protein DRO00_05020 [Thermoproteota archaeon]|nr:MAG: hypothetical protein DRO00_05020 [Candidatus Korarchaeota archaeon]
MGGDIRVVAFPIVGSLFSCIFTPCLLFVSLSAVSSFNFERGESKNLKITEAHHEVNNQSHKEPIPSLGYFSPKKPSQKAELNHRSEGSSPYEIGYYYETVALGTLRAWLPSKYTIRRHPRPTHPADLIITRNKDGKEVFVEVKSGRNFKRALAEARKALREGKSQIILFFARDMGPSKPFFLDPDGRWVEATKGRFRLRLSQAFNGGGNGEG